MSNEEFLRRLSEISPTIEPLEEYTGVSKRINVCCRTCGYKWSPKANELLTGRGCRKCKYVILANKKRRTQIFFFSEKRGASDIACYDTSFLENKKRKQGKAWKNIWAYLNRPFLAQGSQKALIFAHSLKKQPEIQTLWISGCFASVSDIKISLKIFNFFEIKCNIMRLLIVLFMKRI